MRKLIPLFMLASMTLEVQAAAPIGAERSQELRSLLYQDCGSCHGMRLTGGLGPALTSHALVGKPQEYLIATIRDGRPGTPMPPWDKILNESEIKWMVDFLTNMNVQQ